jgi:beta-lactamase regulating signal transducer with metallopeptidase domain
MELSILTVESWPEFRSFFLLCIGIMRCLCIQFLHQCMHYECWLMLACQKLINLGCDCMSYVAVGVARFVFALGSPLAAITSSQAPRSPIIAVSLLHREYVRSTTARAVRQAQTRCERQRLRTNEKYLVTRTASLWFVFGFFEHTFHSVQGRGAQKRKVTVQFARIPGASHPGACSGVWTSSQAGLCR